MQFPLIRNLLLCIPLVFGISMVHAQHYEFHFNYIPTTEEQLPEHQPKASETTSVTINGVRMKSFNTSFENPREMGVLSFRPKPFKAQIKAEFLKRFDVYGMPNGSVFVPNGWKLVYGEIGSSGALSYTFVPEDGGNGYMKFTHHGNCVSCAMIHGSLFFEQALRDARSHDYHFYKSTNLALQVSYLKPDCLVYSVEGAENHIDGLAFYNPQSQLPFWKVEVSLPKSEGKLANQLLNQFMAKYP